MRTSFMTYLLTDAESGVVAAGFQVVGTLNLDLRILMSRHRFASAMTLVLPNSESGASRAASAIFSTRRRLNIYLCAFAMVAIFGVATWLGISWVLKTRGVMAIRLTWLDLHGLLAQLLTTVVHGRTYCVTSEYPDCCGCHDGTPRGQGL